MQIIEPPDLFCKRIAQQQREHEKISIRSTECSSGWEEAAMRFFRNQPETVTAFMTAVNALAKQCRPRCRGDRERAKILIIKTLGRLIREGTLMRVRRRYVRLHEAGESLRTALSLEESRAGRHILDVRRCAGSTVSRSIIHPAIFM